jgi:hypothetical protein
MSLNFYEILNVIIWLPIDALKTNNLDGIVAKITVISIKLVKVGWLFRI